MRVQGFHPIQATPKDSFGFCIRATDQEILPVFHDMGKIIIGRIATGAEIDRRRAAGLAGTCGVYHLAEGAVFIVYASRLDDEVGKAPAQDGVAGIDVSLVIALRGRTAGFIKSVRVMGVAENIQCRAITGNEAEVLKAELPVEGEIPAGVFDVFFRGCREIINSGEQDCFYGIRILHSVEK